MNQHNVIRDLFRKAVQNVASHIKDFVRRPDKDFSRTRKMPAEKLLTFLITEGSSSTRVELIDFFKDDAETMPTASAFHQQRAKIAPEALSAVFYDFNNDFFSRFPAPSSLPEGYRVLAADGSTASFQSGPRFASDDYFVSEGHSRKGFYSIHINALFDLRRKMYVDALLQPVHQKDEFRAFCTMVDRLPLVPGIKDIYIGDRGYCSYNNMAHIIEKKQFFIFRCKDMSDKSFLNGLGLPETGEFDREVSITLTRSNSKKIRIPENSVRRFIGKSISFDFLEYGSDSSYTLKFRVLRIQLDELHSECIVTNLPVSDFPPDAIKSLYFLRWGIETSFRKLKYTIGLSNFHACKAEFIQQEIWARLITYNVTEALIQTTVTQTRDTKYTYCVNFSSAAYICRLFLRQSVHQSLDTPKLLTKELVPIRPGRSSPRLKTAHFRQRKYFTYRAA